ncbi:MAG: hypothetical protein HPY44_10100 [Armatimonadetes bacterium]|nr:hypothetical protein [Armatimonadota bacterium]
MHRLATTRPLPVLIAIFACALSSRLAAQITGVTAQGADLVTPPHSTNDVVLVYGLGFPFQVAPDRAAVFCNVRVEGINVTDYENGTDVIVFNDLEAISADDAVAISRNERETGADGEKRLVVKFPIIGGFVPQGALREDGTPHPHAGSGFGLCQAISFPVDENGHFSWSTKYIHRSEVHQFTYGGEGFRSVRSSSGLEQTHPTVGVWRIVAPGITNAIPDGDDLLLAVSATDGSGQVTGVSRWARSQSRWRPVAFSPVTPPGEGWAEPSLVRDKDGALLFTTRGSGGERYGQVQVWRKNGEGPQWRLVVSTPDVRVWHKQDDGLEWGTVIKLAGAHNSGPISIGSAADGTPYIAANLSGSGRETLCIWPLNAERMDLEKPLTVRAARDEFGPAPGGGAWMVDHPSGAVLRLADGRWHGVLAYRVLGDAEHKGALPTAKTGCYLEEIASSGPPLPPWRFE